VDQARPVAAAITGESAPYDSLAENYVGLPFA
jgi:hypothetical protein